MSWSIGYDENWQRDIGYGVPAICDHPECDRPIHRGLAYVCGTHAFGGSRGCGLHFCGIHLHCGNFRGASQLCKRCMRGKSGKPFDPKPDTPKWMRHKLTDPSWARWRKENVAHVKTLRQTLKGLR